MPAGSTHFREESLLKKLLCGAFALLMAASLGGCSKRFSGGEDTPYPYEWTEKSNGTIVLSIDSAAAPDSEWVPQDYDNSVLDISEQEVKGDHRTCVITPKITGTTTEVTFACEKQVGPLTEHSFEIHFLLQPGKKDRLTVAEHTETAFSGLQVRGEDTDAPYYYQTEKDGTLSVYIECDQTDAIWTKSSTDDSVATAVRQDVLEDGAWYVIQPKGKGKAVITMQDTVSGVKVSIPVTVDENSNVLADGTTAPENGRTSLSDVQFTSEDAA